MSDYEMVKDVVALKIEVEELKALMAQVYGVVDHNIKIKKLEEPKEKK